MNKKLLIALIFIITVVSYSNPEPQELSFKDFIKKVNNRYIQINKTYEKAKAEKEYQLSDEGVNVKFNNRYSSFHDYVSFDSSVAIIKKFSYGTSLSLNYLTFKYSNLNNFFDDETFYINVSVFTFRQSLNEIFEEKNRREFLDNNYKSSLIKSDELRNTIIYSSAKTYMLYLLTKKNINTIENNNKYLKSKIDFFEKLSFEQNMSINLLKDLIEKNTIFINNMKLDLINLNYSLYFILGENTNLVNYEFEDILNNNYFSDNFNKLIKTNENINEKLLQTNIEYAKLKIKSINISNLPKASLSFDSSYFANYADLTKFDEPNNLLSLSFSYNIFDKKDSKYINLKKLSLETLISQYEELKIKNKNILKQYDEILSQRKKNLEKTDYLSSFYQKNSDSRFKLLSILIETNAPIEDLYNESDKIELEINGLFKSNLDSLNEKLNINLEYFTILKNYNLLADYLSK